MKAFGVIFAGVVQPLLDLLSKLTYSDLQQIFAIIAAAPDFDTVIQLLNQVFPPQPGKVSLKDIMDDVKALFDQLMGAIPNTDPAPGSSASGQADDGPEKTLKAILTVVKFFQMATEELMPGTGITIKPDNVKITTSKGASIELKGEDIEIKAKGSVKIEGESVEISPSPCKCG